MKTDIFKERKKNIADLILNNELYVPMKTKEIAILLGIPKDKRYELQEVLDALVADGTIGVSKKGKYMLVFTGWNVVFLVILWIVAAVFY